MGQVINGSLTHGESSGPVLFDYPDGQVSQADPVVDRENEEHLNGAFTPQPHSRNS